MMLTFVLWLLTSLPVMAGAAGLAGVGIAGALLGLFPRIWHYVGLLGGILMLSLFMFIVGFRMSDDIAQRASRIAELTTKLNEANWQLGNEKSVSEAAKKERDALREKKSELDKKVADYEANPPAPVVVKGACACDDRIDGYDLNWRRKLRQRP